VDLGLWDGDIRAEDRNVFCNAFSVSPQFLPEIRHNLRAFLANKFETSGVHLGAAHHVFNKVFICKLIDLLLFFFFFPSLLSLFLVTALVFGLVDVGSFTRPLEQEMSIMGGNMG
jgi:hypothetical protein